MFMNMDEPEKGWRPLPENTSEFELSVALAEAKKRIVALEADNKELCRAVNNAMEAVKEAVPYLETSIGAEVLAWVNGYSGGQDVFALMERLKDDGIGAS